MIPISDDEARRLLGPLAGEPEADARIDVPETMRRGGLRRRNRRAATGATFAAVLAVAVGAGMTLLPGNGSGGVPVAAGSESSGTIPPATPAAWATLPAAPGGPACTTTTFPGAGALPMATDRTGRWSVGSVLGQSKLESPRIWKDGVEFGVVSTPANEVLVSQVNSSGNFAATSFEGDAQPWAYVNNEPTRLRGDDAGTATAISEKGRFGGKLGELPVVWDTHTAKPTMLPLPSGYTVGEVVAIGDDEKTVLGTIGNGRTTDISWADAVGTGVLWLPDGGTRMLPLPKDAEWVRPTAMRGDWVVGLVSDGSAFRYNVARDEIETLPAQIIWPSAVTSDGDVAGMTMPPPIVSGRGFAPSLLSGGEARALWTGDPEGAVYEISGVTDDGTVTGIVMTLGDDTGEEGAGAQAYGFVSTCG